MTSESNEPAHGTGIIAVDLGGTRLRVAIFSADGEMLHKTVIPTPRDDPDALVRAMKDTAGNATVDIEGAVVGVPGPIDYSAGEAIRLPNLPGWAEHVSANKLAVQLRLPVHLANDADLAALGEHRYGAGRGVSDMLYMTSSTGVGGGVIVNGRLLHGKKSLAEVGHMVIDQATGGTVEGLGSGTALAKLAGADGATVQAQAEAGDERALAFFAEVAAAFATGVYNAVHCFMPERVVIGGGVSRAGELLLAPVRERLARCPGCASSGVEVVLAGGGDDVGLLGANAFWQDARAGPERAEHQPATP